MKFSRFLAFISVVVSSSFIFAAQDLREKMQREAAKQPLVQKEGKLVPAVGTLDKAKCLVTRTPFYPEAPGFSFYNKSTVPASITIYNASLPQATKFTGAVKELFSGPSLQTSVPAKHLFNLPVDINTNTSLSIKYGNNMTKKFAFAPRKTIYVSWDKPEKSNDYVLYPQTGPAKGALQTTDMCYGLKDNVRSSDITLKS